MKLSIIVPVYNAEAFLPRCIDSLVAQSIDDFEIILVNDGSKDSSLNVMEEYASRYPSLIKTLTVTNGGQGRARNFGLDIAQGEYIGFVDSDDWVSPDMFRLLHEKAKEENADIAICDILKCFDDGSTLVVPSALTGEVLAAAGSACNKLFKRQLIGALRFPEKMWYEDFVFSAKLLLKSKCTVFLHEALYFYRVGHESTMNNNNALMNLDIIAAVENIKGFMLENDISGDTDYIVINHILLDSINRMAAQSNTGKKAIITKLREYVKKSVPNLSRSAAFKRESRGRRVAMYLNYHGMEKLTKLLLSLKH